MTEDFAEFLAALNSEGVAYVVIGGMETQPLDQPPGIREPHVPQMPLREPLQ